MNHYDNDTIEEIEEMYYTGEITRKEYEKLTKSYYLTIKGFEEEELESLYKDLTNYGRRMSAWEEYLNDLREDTIRHNDIKSLMKVEKEIKQFHSNPDKRKFKDFPEEKQSLNEMLFDILLPLFLIALTVVLVGGGGWLIWTVLAAIGFKTILSIALWGVAIILGLGVVIGVLSFIGEYFFEIIAGLITIIVFLIVPAGIIGGLIHLITLIF